MVAYSEICAPIRLIQQGVHLAFSRYSITVLAVFLNGTARISAHQATWTGERMPMKRASEWIVASLWLRVTPLH